MRLVWVTLVMAAILLASGQHAASQVPTASGRTFTLSNAAWKLFIPNNYYPRYGRGIPISDVLVHFHGDPQTVWNNAKYANLNALVLTVNYSGLSSAYSTPFSNATNPGLFQSVLNEALTKARQQPDISDALAWDKVAVSSFSAGYGAVREILKNPANQTTINSLLAADSLYATTAGDGTAIDSQMVDYKTFATAAKNGTKTFIYSHSQVPTYTYESTGECGDEIMQSLGVSSSALNTNGLGTLNFYRYAQTGNFKLWGALGTDGDSHLEHLRYMGEFLDELPLARAPIPGDYNANGKVDAIDYVLWRITLGSTTDLRANGATTGAGALLIDNADYDAWKGKFGNVAPAGSGAGASVPEPSAALLLFVAACHIAVARRFSTRQP